MSIGKHHTIFALLFALLGVIWVLLTEQLLSLIGPPLLAVEYLSLLKGMLYVLGSTIIMYLLLLADDRHRRQSASSLQAGAATYKLLFEHNPLPMWVYDLQTLQLIAVNDTAVAAYGYTRDEFLRMTLQDIRPAEDAARLQEDVANSWPELNYAGEWRHRRKDGTVFPVEIVSHTLEYDGRAARLVVAHDLTERKRTETKLRESEARFRRLAENAPDLIYRYDFQPEPHFSYVSPAATVITGYTPEDHYADPQLGFTMVAETDRHLLEALVTGELVDGTPLQMRWIRKDGDTIWTEQRNISIVDEKGQFIAVEGIARDVTDQVRTKAALHERERQFRKAIEESPFPAMIHADDGEVLSLSRSWMEITGYELAEISTVSAWTERAYGAHRQVIKEGIDRLYALDKRIDEGEFTITCKNGAQRIWAFSSTPLGPLPDGRRMVMSQAVDITERKQAENQLLLQSAALEAAANAIVITDIDGTIEWLNSAFSQLTGYSQAEALGRNPRELVRSGKHSREFYQELWETILDANVWHGEFINRRKDGTLYIEEETITPVQDANGKLTHFIAIKHDITHRKERESERERLLEQVQTQAEQMMQVLRGVPEGVCLLAEDGSPLLSNALADVQLHLLAGVTDGQKVVRLGKKPLSVVLDRRWVGEWHDIAQDERLFQVSAYPLENNQENREWLLVIREVTEQHMLQQQLQRQERLAAIGQLAAGIAHDFNNIMGVIMLYAQLLTRSATQTEKEAEWLSTIGLQADRAAQLIQQILEFSRQAVLVPRPLDLLPLLKEEVKLLQRTLPETIDIQLQYEGDVFPVQADPTRIQQIIMNLALNARDAMPAGGELIFELACMDVGNEREMMEPGLQLEKGAWVRLRVTDTGTGMETSVLDHIFDPFFTTKEPGKGTGLGLAQVYGIIGQHGGHIIVSSKPGMGTTYTIVLPRLHAAVAVPVAAVLADLPHGHGERILIVEDDAMLREALIEYLQQWEYTVTGAADGEAALVHFQSQPDEIDLVISDIVMPRRSGLELMHALHERGWYPPLIFLTGHPLQDNALVSELQDAEILAKPIDLNRLAHTLQAYLKKAGAG